jgi:hypothetical protein
MWTVGAKHRRCKHDRDFHWVLCDHYLRYDCPQNRGERRNDRHHLWFLFWSMLVVP